MKSVSGPRARTARRVLTCAALSAAVATGCALVPGLAHINAASAQNPLNGKNTLDWSQEDLRLSGDMNAEKDCTTWPLTSKLSVKADQDKICVDGTIYQLIDPNGVTPDDATVRVTSDGAGSDASDKETSETPKGTIRKIGQCVIDNKPLNVWATTFSSSCVGNKDGQGTPVLSEKSSFLKVETVIGNASWKFPAPAAAPASSGAANSDASGAGNNQS